MTNKIYFVIIMTLALVVIVLSVGLAYERGHNNGYNEGWNDGTAYELLEKLADVERYIKERS